MNNYRLYIHIGIKKTATSFLQSKVLGQTNSSRFIAIPEVPVGEEVVRMRSIFGFYPDVWTDQDGRAFANLLEHYGLLSRGVGEEQRDLILSDEGVYGGVASAQPWIPERKWAKIPDWGWEHGPIVRLYRQTEAGPTPESVSSHLKAISETASNWGFSEVKVFANIRRQDTHYASAYAQFSDRVRGACQKNFEDWVRHLIHDPVGYYGGAAFKLDYNELWENLVEVLGEKNVFFLPFEFLREDQEEYLGQLLGFLDTEEATSHHRIVISVQQDE
jgi:hypothetical protein